MYFYKNAFYFDNPPVGAVKINDETHLQLLAAQSRGGKITADENGQPIITRPSHAENIKMAIDIINADTDEKILTGFIYQGKRFYLSLENQLNFKAECDLRMSLSYPVKVKTYDDYLLIGNPSAYLDLYTAACAFIREKIEAGWAKKDQLQTMSEAELRAVIDDGI